MERFRETAAKNILTVTGLTVRFTSTGRNFSKLSKAHRCDPTAQTTWTVGLEAGETVHFTRYRVPSVEPGG
ncbi:hypothetical protein QFZ33_002618 [Arthrobacter globiformis]|nr:hypothetical protein [Arthrobacter globiformis]